MPPLTARRKVIGLVAREARFKARERASAARRPPSVFLRLVLVVGVVVDEPSRLGRATEPLVAGFTSLAEVLDGFPAARTRSSARARFIEILTRAEGGVALGAEAARGLVRGVVLTRDPSQGEQAVCCQP